MVLFCVLLAKTVFTVMGFISHDFFICLYPFMFGIIPHIFALAYSNEISRTTILYVAIFITVIMVCWIVFMILFLLNKKNTTIISAIALATIDFFDLCSYVISIITGGCSMQKIIAVIFNVIIILSLLYFVKRTKRLHV